MNVNAAKVGSAASVSLPAAMAQTGRLDPAQCFSIATRPQCGAGPTVRDEAGVAVAADGKRAYVVVGSTIAHFEGRASIAVYDWNPATQELVYMNCIGVSIDLTCTDWPQRGLFSPQYLEVSPGSEHIYEFGHGVWALKVTVSGLEFASGRHPGRTADDGEVERTVPYLLDPPRDATA